MTLTWKLQHCHTQEIIEISKPVFKIGRERTADICTDSQVISRKHAIITILVGNQLFVQDQGSSNGTYINNIQIPAKEPVSLKHHDIVSFGVNNETQDRVDKIHQYKVIKEDSPVSLTHFVEEPHSSTIEENVPLTKAGPIKMEANTSKFSSCDDDCIVISDDEDDNPFVMSQIFEITEKMKNKPKHSYEDDPYLEIKKELADMDFTNEFGTNFDPIEIEPFSNTEDLLEVLEPSQEECNEGDCDKKNEEDGVQYETANQGKYSSNKHVKHISVFDDEISICSRNNKIKNDIETNKNSHLVVLLHKENVNRKESDKIKKHDKEISSARESKLKYQVPTVVAAHTIQPKRLSKERPVKDKDKHSTEKKRAETADKCHTKKGNDKSSTKRRISVEGPIAEKKQKTDRRHSTGRLSLKKNDTTSLTLDKARRESKSESRRQKLKEISEKQSESKSVNKGKNVTHVPKVRDSARGGFLINEQTSKHPAKNSITQKKGSTKVARSQDKPPPNVLKTSTPVDTTKVLPKVLNTPVLNDPGASRTRIARKVNSTSNPPSVPGVIQAPLISPGKENYIQDNTLSNYIQDKTVSSQRSPSDQMANKTFASNGCTSSRRDRDYITMAQFITETSRPDPTIQDRRLRRRNQLGIANYGDLDNVDDFIKQIVFWNVRWVLEQKDQEISPPINKYPEERIPLDFTSVDKYIAVMQPLVMLELWNYIYSSCTEENRTPFIAALTHVRQTDVLTHLDCECYVPKNSTVFKVDDFILMECKLLDNNKVPYQYTGFAYVTKCSRINSHQDGSSKSYNNKFTLVTRSFDKRVTGTKVLVKLADNIGNFLRMLKTTRYLRMSPLVGYILNPKIEDYRVKVVNEDLSIKANMLNERQREAVVEARQVCLGDEPKIYLLKGPPGTGKSTVLTSLVLDIIFSQKSKETQPLILVTAPSNAAVDCLIGKLALARQKIKDRVVRSRIKIVRVGPDASINKKVERFKLSTLVRNNIISECNLNTCADFKKHSDAGTLDDYLKMKLGNKYHNELKRLEDVILRGCNVICTTLQSCTNPKILYPWRSGRLRNFTCCIVDEATQCTELESLLPLQLGITKFVLVGDPQQLSAMVTNREAQRLGLGMSLFSRIDEKFRNETRRSPIKMLEIQYRMAPEICKYPNQAFYDGKLRSLPHCDNPIEPSLRPYMLFNLTRCQNEDISEFTNIGEVRLIYTLLETLKLNIKKQCIYTVGVIAPYRAQINLLRKEISSIKFPQEVTVIVNTVDSFQGAECDVIIISCVRFNSNCFLQSEQRLNVALTRARQALYVIGNYSLFKHCKTLYDLREDAKQRKLCFDIWTNVRDVSSLQKLIFN